MRQPHSVARRALDQVHNCQMVVGSASTRATMRVFSFRQRCHSSSPCSVLSSGSDDPSSCANKARRGSICSASQPQGPRFRFAPHCGHNPLQSLEQYTGRIVSATAYCQSASVRSRVCLSSITNSGVVSASTGTGLPVTTSIDGTNSSSMSSDTFRVTGSRQRRQATCSTISARPITRTPDGVRTSVTSPLTPTGPGLSSST